MKSKKATKRALLSSALSLVLCFSMLLGTTFAWFTDTASTAVNTIQSGKLDVDIVDENGNSLNEQTMEFVKAAGDSADEAFLWEPGCTYVTEGFQIKNLGNLWLKYQLVINGIDGDSDLLDVIDFWITDNNQSLEKAVELGTYLDDLAPETTSKTYYLVGHMDEDAGNEYQDMSITGVGVTVYATQVDAEFDSFGKDYDKEAPLPWDGTVIDGATFMAKNVNTADKVIEIYHANELAYLATPNTAATVALAAAAETPITSFEGYTIKLMNDLNLGNLPWTPIGTWDNAFAGIFDGQGHTIYNLYINDTDENTGSGVGLFGVAQNATIKGINVRNADITGYEMVATIVGSPYSGCTISDCHVTGDINLVSKWAYVGGICAYGYTKIENCSVVADGTGVITSETRNAVGGISAWLLEDASSIKNCQVKNLELTGWANIGAITGFMHRQGVIDGCSAENVVLTKTREDGHPTIGLAAGGWSYNASKAITVTNNTFKNITLNGTYLASNSADILYGAEYAGSTDSNFVTENNTQENITNNLIEVKVIKTADELKAAMTNGGKYALANKVGTEDWTLEVNETITVPSGVNVVLYMNGKTIAGTNSATATHNDLFLVKGNLTVNGGIITLTHGAANMGWNGATSVFDVTAGGVLNLNGTTVKNLGGTDMNFGVHLNNWGEVTLNVENSTIKSTYCAVRVFNSGPDMNNVTIKNSTIYSEGNRAFWVHNYASADFNGKTYSSSSVDYDEAVVEARLNFDIFGNGNTYVAKTNTNGGVIRYGFNSSVYYTGDGTLIAKAAD